MHLAEISDEIIVGTTVQQGQLIGYVGKTGLAKSPDTPERRAAGYQAESQYLSEVGSATCFDAEASTAMSLPDIPACDTLIACKSQVSANETCRYFASRCSICVCAFYDLGAGYAIGSPGAI